MHHTIIFAGRIVHALEIEAIVRFGKERGLAIIATLNDVLRSS